MRLVRTEFNGATAADAVNALDSYRGGDGFEFVGPFEPRLVMATGELGHSVRAGRLISSGHRYRLQNTHADWFGFARPHSGRIEAWTSSGHLVAGPGQWLFLAPGHRDVLSEGDGSSPFTSTRLLISWQAIVACLESVGMTAVGAVREFSSGPAPAVAALEQAVFSLLDDQYTLTRQREQVSRLEAMVIELTVEALVSAGAIATEPEPRTSLRKVRDAEELIRASATGPISLVSVARELDVGLRSLEATFRSVRGYSARHFLKFARLDHARQRLLTIEEGEDVTTIALESGINHLGRFSTQYAARYGEPPSVTMRVARDQVSA